MFFKGLFGKGFPRVRFSLTVFQDLDWIGFSLDLLDLVFHILDGAKKAGLYDCCNTLLIK